MLSHRLARFGAALLTVGALLAPRAAQAAVPPALTPPLRGTVVDSAGAPIAGVSVIATEVARTTTTAGDGSFTFRGLPAGPIHLSAIFPGHQPAHVVVTIPETGAQPVTVRIVLRRSVLRLQSVQVTASPTGTDPLSITQSTIQVAGRDLQRQLGMSVAQTLSAEPGMGQRFAGPMANVPVIRGLTGERILLLQDGDRAGDLSATSADHAFVVDPNSAERIEVIRGPASLLYGNNALGGVVNVIGNDIPTSIPTRRTGNVSLQGESVNPGAVGNASLLMPLGSRFALTAKGGIRRNEDYRAGGNLRQDNTDARAWNGTAGLGYVGDRASFGVAFRNQDFEYGMPFDAADGEAIRLDGFRRNLQWRGGLTTGSQALSYIRVDGGATWYGHDEIEPNGEIGTRFRLNTQTLNVTGRTRLGRLSGAVGLQGLRRQYAPTGEEAFTPQADNDNAAVFLYQELPLGGAADATELRTPKLQFGARWDTWSVKSKANDPDRFGPARSRTFSNASGSLGASVPFGGIWSLSGSVARAFRAPTVEELYANGEHKAVGTVDIGNANLRAETSTGGEAILRAQSGRSFLQLSAYATRIDDYILPIAVRDTTLVEDGEIEVKPLVNFIQRNATLRGFELSGETAVTSSLVLGVMSDVVRGTVSGGGNLPFIPAARIGGHARWDTGRLQLGADVRHAFEQTRVSDANPTATRNASDIATGSYTLLNLHATWTVVGGASAQTITLRADNLLDEQFRDAASRVKSFTFNPGRNISVVYRIGF